MLAADVLRSVVLMMLRALTQRPQRFTGVQMHSAVAGNHSSCAWGSNITVVDSEVSDLCDLSRQGQQKR